MITIKSYKAGKGDAFLISFGENKEHNIMIDMGISSTYNEIKPDLELLKNNGKKLDLLVVTHMHDDHIDGVIDFINDNGLNKNIIEIDEIWHNSYRHLQFKDDVKKDKNTDKHTIRILDSIIKNGSLSARKNAEYNIHGVHGSTLAGSLLGFNYIPNWNTQFQGKAVKVDSNIPKWVGDEIKIILLSPDDVKLDELSDEWYSKLKIERRNIQLSGEAIFDDALEFYMRNESIYESSDESISATTGSDLDLEELYKSNDNKKDKSNGNGASIAFIIEYNENKLLFLGDAHRDIIIKNLKKLKEHNYKLDFDLVKVSHHGSNNNISKELLALIQSKRFLISTDGQKHGRAQHPNKEAIAKIIMSKKEFHKEIIFNYDLNIVSDLEKFTNAYNYSLSLSFISEDKQDKNRNVTYIEEIVI